MRNKIKVCNGVDHYVRPFTKQEIALHKKLVSIEKSIKKGSSTTEMQAWKRGFRKGLKFAIEAISD